MNKLGLIWLCLSVLFSAYLLTLPLSLQAQSQPASDSSIKTTSGNGTSVSVTATVAVQVSNQTLKTKETLLKGAVYNFLNSGPNVLKSTLTDQPVVKTKITNQISKATQNVEGIEATNAIIGVEVGKALKNLISSSTTSNQSSLVTLVASSTCKATDDRSISCENSVTIK